MSDKREAEWRKKFAPDGYHFVRHCVGFGLLHKAKVPEFYLEAVMNDLAFKLKDKGFDTWTRVWTFIRLYPMDSGETLNHHDRLVPRHGIEIEVRIPIRK